MEVIEFIKNCLPKFLVESQRNIDICKAIITPGTIANTIFEIGRLYERHKIDGEKMSTNVSIETIKELRARTHLGMNECKKALEQTENNIEQAIELLQKRGLKKVDDLILALEGKVKAAKNEEATFAVIAEVNCQTDFGAKSELFTQFVDGVLAVNLTSEEQNCNNDKPYSYEGLAMILNQLGEKVVVRRVERRVSDGYLSIYNHTAGNIAVIAEFGLEYDDYFDHALADNIAMHTAACKPLALARAGLENKDLYARLSSFNEDALNKPEAMRQKIVDGKMDRWCSEVVLLEQKAIFVENSTKTIHELLRERGMILRSFVRYERGEVV